MTGKELDSLPNGEYRALIHEHHTQVIRRRRPVYVMREHRFSDHGCWKCEALSLPLASDGAAIDMLMSAVMWEERRSGRRSLRG